MSAITPTLPAIVNTNSQWRYFLPHCLSHHIRIYVQTKLWIIEIHVDQTCLDWKITRKQIVKAISHKTILYFVEFKKHQLNQADLMKHWKMKSLCTNATDKSFFLFFICHNVDKLHRFDLSFNLNIPWHISHVHSFVPRLP